MKRAASRSIVGAIAGFVVIILPVLFLDPLNRLEVRLSVVDYREPGYWRNGPMGPVNRVRNPRTPRLPSSEIRRAAVSLRYGPYGFRTLKTSTLRLSAPKAVYTRKPFRAISTACG